MFKTVVGWVVQGAAKAIIAALLGSAALAAAIDALLQTYFAMSGSWRVSAWLTAAFLAYVALLQVFSRFPALLGGDPAPSIPLIPESWSAWYQQPLQVVHHKSFENQDVPLDGYKYDHCRFKNVTFKISGAAPFGLLMPEISGSVHVECPHPVHKAVTVFQEYIVANFPGSFRAGIKDDYGNVKWTQELKFDPKADFNTDQ